jgi:hypothetical protein
MAQAYTPETGRPPFLFILIEKLGANSPFCEFYMLSLERLFAGREPMPAGATRHGKGAAG